jgi:hypothetical protein
MSKILSLPKGIIGFLNSPVIKANLNTTSWLVIGAMLFQGLSMILTRRIATLLAFAALFAKIVPVILLTTGKIPNEELKNVNPGKTTVLFPKPDGSKGTPSGRGFALLILGIKVSHPLGVFSPGAKETGDFFQALVKDLNQRKKENGYLGGGSNMGDHGIFLTGYFESMEALHNFAHGAMHRDAWNWWNKNVVNMPHIGVYHEAYDIPANHWEAVYLQTPSLGLGKSLTFLEGGQSADIIADARKGVWRSSAGRMGREEGKLNEFDPYKHE